MDLVNTEFEMFSLNSDWSFSFRCTIGGSLLLFAGMTMIICGSVGLGEDHSVIIILSCLCVLIHSCTFGAHISVPSFLHVCTVWVSVHGDGKHMPGNARNEGLMWSMAHSKAHQP